MQAYDLLKKEWLISRTARTVYRTAAVVSLGSLPVIVAIQQSSPVPAYLKQLLLLSLVGMALNGAAMECFLFRFDKSGVLKQIFWFCAMIFIPIGPAMYCFLVYSRSSVFKQDNATSSNAAGAVAHESVENRDLR